MKIKLNPVSILPPENEPVLMVSTKDYVGVAIYSDGVWKTFPGDHYFKVSGYFWISFESEKNDITNYLMDQYEPVLKRLSNT